MNIIEGIQEQSNRVRELIKLYKAIPTGFVAVELMSLAIREGERAIASGDVVRMIGAYKTLEGFED